MRRGRTESGRLIIIVLGQAIRCEKQAVLTEEAGGDATDWWAKARELRDEAGQDPVIWNACASHIRATVNQWRAAGAA